MLTFLVRLLLSPSPLNIPPSGQRPFILPHVHLFLGPRSSFTPVSLVLARAATGSPRTLAERLPRRTCSPTPYISPPYSPPLSSPSLSSDLRATGWPFPPCGLARLPISLPKTNQPSPSINTSTADQNHLAALALLPPHYDDGVNIYPSPTFTRWSLPLARRRRSRCGASTILTSPVTIFITLGPNHSQTKTQSTLDRGSKSRSNNPWDCSAASTTGPTHRPWGVSSASRALVMYTTLSSHQLLRIKLTSPRSTAR